MSVDAFGGRAFALLFAGCALSLAGCVGGGVHEAAGGLQIVKKYRKAGIITVGGLRHAFDGPVNMQYAENIAFAQCVQWGYDSMDLSSAKNVGSQDSSVNTAAALGTILGGHSPAFDVEIVYECYNK